MKHRTNKTQGPQCAWMGTASKAAAQKSHGHGLTTAATRGPHPMPVRVDGRAL